MPSSQKKVLPSWLLTRSELKTLPLGHCLGSDTANEVKAMPILKRFWKRSSMMIFLLSWVDSSYGCRDNRYCHNSNNSCRHLLWRVPRHCWCYYYSAIAPAVSIAFLFFFSSLSSTSQGKAAGPRVASIISTRPLVKPLSALPPQIFLLHAHFVLFSAPRWRATRAHTAGEKHTTAVGLEW